MIAHNPEKYMIKLKDQSAHGERSFDNQMEDHTKHQESTNKIY